VGGIFLEAAATSSNFDPTWPNLTYAQFELGLAQVEVRVDAQTNRVLAGVPFVLTVTVTNLGPDSAEDVPLYSEGLATQRCTVYERRYWPDFLGAGYSLSQGDVVEFHSDGIPWHVRLGRIPPLGFARLNLSLVPAHTGELPFSASARKTDRDTNYVSVLIPVSGGPGIIEFSVPHTNFWEDAGTAVVEVLRHDGAEGTVEVSYSTRDGDAVAGRDYTATRGTLTFGPGETSKTVMVSLLNNPRGECNRQLSLSLSNARGGAFPRNGRFAKGIPNYGDTGSSRYKSNEQGPTFSFFLPALGTSVIR